MAEETSVRRGGDAPAEFSWGGRVHRVVAVLEHRRYRWSPRYPGASGGAGAVPAGEPAVDEPGSAESLRELVAGLGLGVGPPSDPEPPGNVGDHEVWQVRAVPVRGGRPSVFDLRFDWAAGRWSVRRTDPEQEEG